MSLRKKVTGAALSTVASETTSAALLAAKDSRNGVIIHNSDANPLYIKYGVTASATDFTERIPTNGSWEMPEPIYTGVIHGIWPTAGTGSAHITEL
jgi:hypothetical protein